MCFFSPKVKVSEFRVRVQGLGFAVIDAVKVWIRYEFESFVRREEQLWPDCGGPLFSHPTPSEAAKPAKPIRCFVSGGRCQGLGGSQQGPNKGSGNCTQVPQGVAVGPGSVCGIEVEGLRRRPPPPHCRGGLGLSLGFGVQGFGIRVRVRV